MEKEFADIMVDIILGYIHEHYAKQAEKVYALGVKAGQDAEQERCINAICDKCADGNEVHIVEGQQLHWVATEWLHNKYVPCKAAAIRNQT